MKNQKSSIKFDLLNNAKDSLRQAVEMLAVKAIGSDHGRLKHSITSIAHCIELLLKERLRLVDPALVFENLNKYPSRVARTVTADTAISLLKSKGGVFFSDDDERSLKSLRITRNNIEHYEWEASEKEAKIIVVQALSFAFDFAKNELELDLSADFKGDNTWNMLLKELHDFAKVHGERLEAGMRANGKLPQCCDDCGELTVPLWGGSCLLCGHWQAIDD